MAWYVQVGSRNRKVGGWSTRTDESSCSPTCPFKGHGCYAEFGPLAWAWRKMSGALEWSDFCQWVASLPAGTVWRHNDAGDLPHTGGTIDREACLELARENMGRRGYTYTHHNVWGDTLQARKNRNTLRKLRRMGFVVSISTESCSQADMACELGIGPAVVVVPESYPDKGRTPSGRQVIVCLHQTGKRESCVDCKLCAIPERGYVIAFRAHGVTPSRL